MKICMSWSAAALSVLILLCGAGCTNSALSGPLATAATAFSFEPAAGDIVWWSADNAPMKRALTDAEAGSGTVTLSVRKGSVTPILLYRTGVLEPAGCIWPVSATLDDSGGFCARMLWRLLTETDSASGPPEAIRAFCERFNWNRFCKVVATIEKPWELNQTKILRAIAEGTFTQKCLK